MTLVCVRPHFSNAKFLFSYPVFNFPKVFFFVVVVAKEKCITFYLRTLWNSVSNGQLGMRIAKDTGRKFRGKFLRTKKFL